MSTDLLDLDDKRRLELTLQTREKIIQTLVAKGPVPGDRDDRDLLMKAMDSMDRTVLTKAKIKSDDSAAQSQAASSKLVAQLLLQRSQAQQGKRTEPVVLDNAYDINDVVDGEMLIGVQAIKSNEITRPQG